jgi:EAL and modified HD-GYP domain-containing signal transduction protein
VYGFRHRILTIQAALSAVSEDAFRKLVTVVLSSKLRQSLLEGDTERALERACFCESLALILNENAAELYMLGMLSMMDRMLNIPMNRLVALIAVAPRMREALLGSTEGLGRALTLCKYEERGGSLQGLIHPDESVRDSSSYYFRALIAAAQNLRGFSARAGFLAWK